MIFEVKNYTFEIITPIVMGGADIQNPELRESSIKGIVRWWYRFYKGTFLSLEDLRKEEAEIFGSQERASKIRIRIKNKKFNKQDVYLCMNDTRGFYSQRKRKGFYDNDKKLSIEFKISPTLEENYIDDLEKTLQFLSCFGGIGARWRRGFGSVEKEEDIQTSLEDTLKRWEKVLREIKNSKQTVYKNPRDSEFMHLGNTKIFILRAINREWINWEYVMNDLRDKFYRQLKKNLNVDKIVCEKCGEREISPLIIQIKKLRNEFYSVVLLWKEWNRSEETENLIKNNNTFKNAFEIMELR